MIILNFIKSLLVPSIASLICFCITGNSFASTSNRTMWYGVLAPMASESSSIERTMTAKHVKTIDNVKYHLGKIGNKNIVLVNSGIGLINAAAISARLIKDFHPVEIILSGSAGSINSNLKIGDVIIAKQVFNADYGKLTPKGPTLEIADNPNPQDNRQIPLLFDANFNLQKIMSTVPISVNYHVVLGIVADSDNLPNSASQIALLKANRVDAIAMEGAALAQTCWLFHTKCLIIRGVSNVAGEKITDEGTVLAAKNASLMAINVIQNS
jgi:adenosylhomocysteine nucleosidase